MNFSNFALGINIIISLTMIFLGFSAYMAKKQSAANKNFFFFTILFSLWISSNFLQAYFKDIKLVELFLHLDFFFAPIGTYFMLMFMLNFPQNDKKLSSFWPKIFLFLPMAAISILSLTDLVMRDLMIEEGKIIYKESVLYFFYESLIVLYFVWGLFSLVYKYKEARGFIREQISYVLFGFAAVFGVIIFFNASLHNIVSREILQLTNIFSVFLVICIVYATQEYKLLNLNKDQDNNLE